jgi:hypothetical protein
MARFTSKQQLIDEILAERDRLDKALLGLGPQEMAAPGVSGKGRWSVKDMLAHLTAWEQMVRGWYEAGKRGEEVRTPAPDLSWRQLPLLNERIFEQHRKRSLKAVTKDFAASYAKTLALARSLSEKDLLTPGRWPWLGKLALASYIGGCTSSHYRWARTRIVKWRRARGIGDGE